MRVRPGKVPMPPPPDKRNPLRPGPMPIGGKSRLPLGPPRTGGDMLPPTPPVGMKKGGVVKANKSKSQKSKRIDGCAIKGKTRGRIV